MTLCSRLLPLCSAETRINQVMLSLRVLELLQLLFFWKMYFGSHSAGLYYPLEVNERMQCSLTEGCSEVILSFKVPQIFFSFYSVPFAFSTVVRGLWIFSEANFYCYYRLLYRCGKLSWRVNYHPGNFWSTAKKVVLKCTYFTKRKQARGGKI